MCGRAVTGFLPEKQNHLQVFSQAHKLHAGMAGTPPVVPPRPNYGTAVKRTCKHIRTVCTMQQQRNAEIQLGISSKDQPNSNTSQREKIKCVRTIVHRAKDVKCRGGNADAKRTPANKSTAAFYVLNNSRAAPSSGSKHVASLTRGGNEKTKSENLTRSCTRLLVVGSRIPL